MTIPDGFRETTAAIVARFVQTVVVVDDEAFSSFIESDDGQTRMVRAPLVAPGGAAQSDASASEPTTATPPAQEQPAIPISSARDEMPQPHQSQPQEGGRDEARGAQLETALEAATEPADSKDLAEDLDGRRLMALFAEQGLVCSVLQPSSREDHLAIQSATVAAARRADVVILDWVLHKDSGERALSLIQKILEADSGRRMRLIIVYTGTPDTQNIAKRILRTFESHSLRKDGNYALQAQSLRIVVLQKPGTLTRRSSNAVMLDALPSRVLEEFAKISAGLISNVALESIAQIRNNTHAILARLHPNLDAPYLAHRLLLPNPEDATSFAVEIVGDEIMSMLHAFDVGRVSDVGAINSWLGDDDQRLKSGAATLMIENRDHALAALTAGFSSWKRDGLDEDKRRTLERDIHKNATKVFADDKRAPDLEREFAFRSAMIERYRSEQPPPRLGLGTIVYDAKEDECLACIHPLCDSVRLSQATRFIFLLAREGSSPNIVVHEGTKWVRYRLSEKVVDLRQLSFDPENGHVRATVVGDQLVFTAGDGRQLIWRGQLKFAFAQRLVQRFASALSRVGFDEFEWLRRHSRDA